MVKLEQLRQSTGGIYGQVECTLAIARQFITLTTEVSLCFGQVIRTGDWSISSAVAVKGVRPWASMIAFRASAGTRYAAATQVIRGV